MYLKRNQSRRIAARWKTWRSPLWRRTGFRVSKSEKHIHIPEAGPIPPHRGEKNEKMKFLITCRGENGILLIFEPPGVNHTGICLLHTIHIFTRTSIVTSKRVRYSRGCWRVSVWGQQKRPITYPKRDQTRRIALPCPSLSRLTRCLLLLISRWARL